ncbi:peptide/nickel transport system permease protein [Bradyrhizobium sp. F1.4.3]|uniref:ABC transporter permease n=1 Tax=Bradyrhizobium sp. F1.4.3 TaxID=3156356 RepID=UPI00339AF680
MNHQTPSSSMAAHLQAVELPTRRTNSEWRALRFLKRHPQIAAGSLILLVVTLVAILAPLLGTVDPRAISVTKRLRPPSAEFWFGTDALGRDLYSRVVYGTRISVGVSVSCAFLSCVGGTIVGMVAASGRWADSVVMRVMDGFMSIPSMLLAIALMAATRGSVGTVIAAITVVEIPRVARVIRGVMLALREMPFVEAAIAAGSTTPKILVRHLLPAVVSPLTVQATFVGSAAIIIEASLSFIGAGTPPTIPSWGNIMADGKALWQVKPHLVFIPAAFLGVTILGVNLLGDGLRDALDPRMAERS